MELIHNLKLRKLSELAVDKLFEELNRIDKETFIALSPGSSTRDFLEALIEKADELPIAKWELIKFCLVDERNVSLTSNHSNYKELRENLFNYLLAKGKIKETQIIKYDVEERNALLAYNVKVKKIDIAILGVGADGHTASLFPGHSSVEDLRNEYIMIKDSPKEPKERITLTRTILKNSLTFIFFISEGKRKAYENFNDEKISEKQCPAKLAKKSKKLYVVTNLN